MKSKAAGILHQGLGRLHLGVFHTQFSEGFNWNLRWQCVRVWICSLKLMLGPHLEATKISIKSSFLWWLRLQSFERIAMLKVKVP